MEQDLVAKESVATSVPKVKVIVKKVKVKKKSSITGYFFNLFFYTLFIAALLATDFILFADAANSNLFSTPYALTYQAKMILMGIGVFSLAFVFLFSFSAFMQKLFASFIFGCFVIMIMNHFALFDETSFLYGLVEGVLNDKIALKTIGSSHIIMAVIFGVILFAFFIFSKKSSIAYFIGSVILICGYVGFYKCVNYQEKPEFETLIDVEKGAEVSNPRKFVYIAVPNLASYSFLNNIRDDKNESDRVNKLTDTMLAFYAKHNFTIYPNAYVDDNNETTNLVKNMNGEEAKEISINGYFDFSRINDKTVYLKENKMLDTFRSRDYKLTAYQSRGVELCKVNNVFAVDKCVEKQNMPSNVQKTAVLAAEWIESTGILNNFSALHFMVNLVMSADEKPIVGVPYSKLYVVDSFKILDLLTEDIAKDKSDNAYFVFMDLPSDMYVYDEFCKLKSPSFWTSLEKFPWVKNANLFKKRNAYVDQTLCMFGKLEEFMQKIDANTTVVLQGLSGAADLHAETSGYELVNLAIKDPSQTDFAVKLDTCRASDILKGYLFNTEEKCEEIAAPELKNLIITGKTVNAAKRNFEVWYLDWLKFNDFDKYNQIIESMKEEPKSWVDEIEELEVERIEIKETPKTAEPLPEVVEVEEKITVKVEDNTEIITVEEEEKPEDVKDILNDILEKNVEIEEGNTTETPVLPIEESNLDETPGE